MTPVFSIKPSSEATNCTRFSLKSQSAQPQGNLLQFRIVDGYRVPNLGLCLSLVKTSCSEPKTAMKDPHIPSQQQWLIKVHTIMLVYDSPLSTRQFDYLVFYGSHSSPA